MATAVIVRARPAVTVRWNAWVPSVAVATVVGALLLMTPSVSGFAFIVGNVAYMAGAASGGYAVVAGLCVVTGVLLGRRWPLWATALALLPFTAMPWSGGFVWGWWLGILAIAALAALDGLVRAVVPVVAATLVILWYCSTESPAYLPIGAVTSGTGDGFEVATFVAYGLAVVVTVGTVALVGSVQRSRLREAGVVAAERRALQVESLAGERARLARDLHDVVAHHVSLVAVRAESAPFLHPDLNDDAREVLAAIATDAREALTELRQVLVVLQRTSGEGERTPQPTACDVDDLVASAVAAGQPVDLSGGWHDVPPATGYVLYRAVQEGLTNARRHAAGTRTTVRRTQTADAVGFRMTNPADRGAEPGRGLIGMRERVEALGGTMTAVVVDKEFVLDVAVPV
ncbi:histidine kinase [uncultured Cellulomonas sp.]|uniref:sensor histidine kinase n=1 Tax=uncultured Cellulomonas sp. TaxID=189682 RepID=UPI0028EB3778|nr:histidine kinase [uncultured Cellulomonas sp.]